MKQWIKFILVVWAVLLGVQAAQAVSGLVLYTDTIDTGKTLIPNMPLEVASNTLGFYCEYTKDRKNVTITAIVADSKVTTIKNIIKTDGDKIKVVKETKQAEITPTITATIVIDSTATPVKLKGTKNEKTK